MNIQPYFMKFSRTLILIFALAGMLPPLVFRAIDWYHGNPQSPWFEFSIDILSSVITTVTISYAIVSLLIWLQKTYPWKNGVIKRLVLEVILTTFTAMSLIVLLTFVTLPIDPVEDLGAALFNNLVVAFIMNMVLVAVTEGIFFFKQWNEKSIEAERFKKESIRAQLESLKNQVNPHFLFNSLNTLSSMIDHDQEMSKEFLDNLSSVYRYVLQHKDEEVVTLKTELDFIYAYTDLLKKRHGDRMSFVFNINKTELDKGVPPMTLQLLIENAVKHNIASRKKPLSVEVFSENSHLVVRNNLQLKKEVISTGIGLENIRNRYNFLVDEDIEVIQDEGSFVVKVPIIDVRL